MSSVRCEWRAILARLNERSPPPRGEWRVLLRQEGEYAVCVLSPRAPPRVVCAGLDEAAFQRAVFLAASV